jgi:6-phosphogluconolactonase/glucosamine-6-phosphate isomerase/deaminase
MSGLRVQILEDPETVVDTTARTIRRRLTGTLRRTGTACMALSGGSTGTDLAHALAAGGPLPAANGWSSVAVWQVDERVAPDGHPDRNANALAALAAVGARIHEMPVTADDLAAAAAQYAAGMPERFDVVHLGVGPDGHTASWPPGDPVVDTPAGQRVAVVGPFNGRLRMTMLPGPVNAATSRVVLVSGADKAPAIAGWIEGAPFDGDLPVRHVHRSATTLILDRAAAAELSRSSP